MVMNFYIILTLAYITCPHKQFSPLVVRCTGLMCNKVRTLAGPMGLLCVRSPDQLPALSGAGDSGVGVKAAPLRRRP